MSPNLELNRLAVHYVNRNADGPVYAPREQDVAALSPIIITFLQDLVSEVWDAPDTGSTRSGRFVPDDHERLGPSVAKRYVETIIRREDRFLDATKDLARHLYQRSHPRASPGVLAVARLVRPDDGKIFVAILKIRHKDERFVRILSDALTQLEVEVVENMLLQEIQKGTIVPHPDRRDYDLKVVDKILSDEPARYFTEGFLGCLTKKSDEHQVKELLPELQRYARARGLPITVDKLPQVIQTLQRQDTAVTTAVVADVVQEQEVFGPEFHPDDFKTYIEQESNLGPVNIPRKRFAGRGKKARSPRTLTFRFRDPALRKVTLMGPPDTLASIMSIDGDQVTFCIQTTRDGFEVKYE